MSSLGSMPTDIDYSNLNFADFTGTTNVSSDRSTAAMALPAV